ncbi:MAG TPA: helix-turn-helix domain-containing protein [Burkholderiales bacterium]|nr:helix-turn-helix domain-containing protein [Burkholderiales bacterium]
MAPEAGGAAPNVRLREARQAQNLTTADVARRLKLSVWQVEALESGQYQQLPGPIFVRGFIRNYARLLKLDADELVHAVSGFLPQSTPGPETPPSRDIPFPAAATGRWRPYAVAAAVVVAVLAAYEFYFNGPRTTVATQSGPPAASSVTPASKPAAPAQKAPAEPSKPRATVTAAPAQAAAAAPAPAAASAQQPRERIPHPDDREVRFVFNDESWVEVRDRNDQTIFAQLNRAGTTRRVIGLPPLHIVVGNSQGVRMTYGGREIDLARHTKIDVARLTLE